jgi:carbonic anhydrase
MKLKDLKLVLLFLFLYTTACKKTNTNEEKVTTKVNIEVDKNTGVENKEKTTNEHAKHWSYKNETGPEHWAEFEKSGNCDGTSQSPINIINIDAKKDASLKPLALEYAKNIKLHDVTNNGHSIQFNFEKGDYLVFNGEKYFLKQFHFHEASEHTLNGIRYPIEIHLVHQNENGAITVIGIFAEEGKNSSPFTILENNLPLKIGETKELNIPFDISSILPENKSYFNYSGSLTTPPCSEKVNWIILKNPITISLSQVKIIQNIMPLNNYRNEQPLNSRIVKVLDL